MRINLLHNHYNEEKLSQVMDQMKKMGAPEIRAIWSEVHGEWMAVEGCHRLRAAAALGIQPVIINISDNETAIIQVDGEDVEIYVADLAEEVETNLWKATGFKF